MAIRQSTAQDLEKVADIIRDLQVSRDQPNWNDQETGLFEYSKSIEELEKALNPLFLVAETNKGLRGFSLAYSAHFFRKNFEKTDAPEYRFILDNFIDDYVYIDQLGVLNHKSLGAGRLVTSLFNKTKKLARDLSIGKALAYVCQEPIENKRSANFLRRNHFTKTSEVQIENEITLALYEKDI